MAGLRPSAGTSRERDEDLRNTAKAATTDRHFHLLDEPAVHAYMDIARKAMYLCIRCAIPHRRGRGRGTNL